MVSTTVDFSLKSCRSLSKLSKDSLLLSDSIELISVSGWAKTWINFWKTDFPFFVDMFDILNKLTYFVQIAL